MQNLRQMQLEMVKMIAEVDRLFKENGIKYTLLGGSVLGAIRHKGFIPWDDDMDIAVWRKDFQRTENLLANLQKYTYEFAQKQIIPHSPRGRLHLINEKYPIEFSPTIDVFALDKVPSTKFGIKFVNFVAFLCYATTRRQSNKPIKQFIFQNTPKFVLDFIQKTSYNFIENLNNKNYKNLGNVFGFWHAKEYFPSEIYDEIEYAEFE